MKKVQETLGRYHPSFILMEGDNKDKFFCFYISFKSGVTLLDLEGLNQFFLCILRFISFFYFFLGL